MLPGFFLIPEGFLIIAQGFNLGTTRQNAISPEGTAEKVCRNNEDADSPRKKEAP